MSEKGNCYDNAMVETFFKTIKSEMVWGTVFYTRDQAAQTIARYIDGFYNPVRRHSALDYISPRSSNEPRHTEQMPLHLSGASPAFGTGAMALNSKKQHCCPKWQSGLAR
ncbi:MAG: transposase [Sphingomonas sp.]|jgi:truncated hemoglobin YjbI|nr:transposase [Sphingomonas sp.]